MSVNTNNDEAPSRPDRQRRWMSPFRNTSNASTYQQLIPESALGRANSRRTNTMVRGIDRRRLETPVSGNYPTTSPDEKSPLNHETDTESSASRRTRVERREAEEELERRELPLTKEAIPRTVEGNAHRQSEQYRRHGGWPRWPRATVGGRQSTAGRPPSAAGRRPTTVTKSRRQAAGGGAAKAARFRRRRRTERRPPQRLLLLAHFHIQIHIHEQI